MKTRINLDEIRAAIAAVKRKKCCGAADVAAEEVRAELDFKGSNSTSGPLIRSMLDEASLAENLDYGKLSNRLKAAFISELRRVADDATEDLRRQLSESARINDELRNKCTGVTTELTDLKHKAALDRADAAEKIATIEKAHSEAKGAISTFEETKRGLLSQLDEAKSELGEKRDEITTLKIGLKTAQDSQEKMAQKLDDLTDKLGKTETDYQTCQRDRDLAESKIKPLEDRLDELKAEKKRLVEQSDRQADEIGRLSEALLSAAQKRADAAEAKLEGLAEPEKPQTSSTPARRQGTSKGAKGAEC